MITLSNKKHKIKDNQVEDENDEPLARLNQVELDITETKEFNHLSAEAFLVLKEEINKLWQIIESVVIPQEKDTDSTQMTTFNGYG